MTVLGQIRRGVPAAMLGELRQGKPTCPGGIGSEPGVGLLVWLVPFHQGEESFRAWSGVVNKGLRLGRIAICRQGRVAYAVAADVPAIIIRLVWAVGAGLRERVAGGAGGF